MGHFWIFLRRVKQKKLFFSNFLPLMTVISKNKSHPCARNCALTNFLFLKIEKSWKKYFWNTLLSAPRDPLLRPPMTSQVFETYNTNQLCNSDQYVLYSAYFIQENRTDFKSHRMGVTLGPPGGLQEAPHTIFCKNNTTISPKTSLG